MIPEAEICSISKDVREVEVCQWDGDLGSTELGIRGA